MATRYPGPRPGAVTLAVLAEQLGVHVSTVSRALSDHPVGVGSATIDRVRALADELGYRSNVAARSLRTGRTRLIGVMVPRLTDLVLAPISAAIDPPRTAPAHHT